MKIIESSQNMQSLALELKSLKQKLILVPTMGALHEGHLALVDQAKQLGDKVVLSVFVNPTQFGAGEDFEKYPRPLEKDQELAQARGVDYFFVPKASEVYPAGDQTVVMVTELSRGLCGAFRPGHFRGVATVVTKLFLICQPHAAVFGEKDYQQLQVIKRLAQDLHFPIKIIGVPTLREKDGLALSSRNAYLNTLQRQIALKLPQSLQWAVRAVQQGEQESRVIKEKIIQDLQDPQIKIDYIEVVDSETLEPLPKIKAQARLLAAIRVGETRLIDNLPLKL
ncbi:MAG: pantoate--beta-alanine ligase [Deltaproteobacteria bacterium]|nr:pantoate--beta-alanine ligase [Deltaproteobacteria bacterium]